MNPEPHGLTCPKCHGAMRAYERGGVTIDQCADCRGVYLDRGELDRLIDSESAFYQDRPAPAPAPAASRYDDRRFDDRHDDYRRDDYRRDDRGHDGYRGHDRHGYGGHYKKKKGFLSELFD